MKLNVMFAGIEFEETLLSEACLLICHLTILLTFVNAPGHINFNLLCY